MQVNEVMTENPVSIEREQTLQRAAQLMIDHDCGSLPVTDSGALCGVITDRDITVRGVAAGMPGSHPVHHAMSDDVVTIGSDASTQEAAQLMAQEQLRRLYVVDDGSLVGVVALADLAQEETAEQASQALEGISQ